MTVSVAHLYISVTGCGVFQRFGRGIYDSGAILQFWTILDPIFSPITDIEHGIV